MGDDSGRPSLSVVSENSDRDINRSIALDKASRALVELAANILRVVRGAGRPYTIGRECVRVIEAFEEYWSIAGCWPSSEEIGKAVEFSDNPSLEIGAAWSDVHFARSMVVRGALQFAASDLLQQRTQKHAGDREIMNGVRALSDALDAHRRTVQSKLKAQQAIEKGQRAAKSAPKKRASSRSRKKGLEL